MEHNLMLYCVDYLMFDSPVKVYHMGLKSIDVIDGTTVVFVYEKADKWGEYEIPTRIWLDKGEFTPEECLKMEEFALCNESLIMDEVRGID